MKCTDVLEMLQGYATQLEMMHYFAGIMKCVTRMDEICHSTVCAMAKPRTFHVCRANISFALRISYAERQISLQLACKLLLLKLKHIEVIVSTSLLKKLIVVAHLHNFAM